MFENVYIIVFLSFMIDVVVIHLGFKIFTCFPSPRVVRFIKKKTKQIGEAVKFEFLINSI